MGSIMAKTGKSLMFAGILFAALLAIGFMSIKSSDYRDVSSLKSLGYEAYVTVRGTPVNLASGSYLLRIGDTVYSMKGFGSYGVAERVNGPPFGNDDSYAVFVLEGKDGFRVVALYSANEFKNLYGGSPSVSSRVVVEGRYEPSVHVIIMNTATGEVEEYPLLMVSKILEGCHESYQAPAGRLES